MSSVGKATESPCASVGISGSEVLLAAQRALRDVREGGAVLLEADPNPVPAPGRALTD